MTKEEIEELKGLAASMGLYDDRHPCKRAVILGKAIELLEQEPCDDCISRQAALDCLTATKLKKFDFILYAREGIKKLPPVTPQALNQEPKQVELEGDGYAYGTDEIVYDFGKCPTCGWKFEEGDKDWEEPYCCHCGQKLEWFDDETESEE